MTTPYADLPPERYWRSGVADVHATGLSGLYQKKFDIARKDRIATAGSCFAQHVARHLTKHDFNVLDAETSPLDLPDEVARRFGYRIYSGRYGNLYTARQLLQLLKDAASGTVRPEDVWEKNGRFYDGLRPSVEPDGLASPEEVMAHRREHLGFVDELFSNVDVLIFTLGLTEAWVHRASGAVYPICPGVIAGAYDPAEHAFKNFEFDEILADMLEVNEILKARNGNFRMMVTVSPVPLTATASGDHVLAATTFSKSTLRAVAGSLRNRCDNIDYFPSYEIITSPSSRGMFYEPNLRSVTEIGVETVMKTLLSQHAGDKPAEAAPKERPAPEKDDAPRKAKRGGGKKKKDDLVCEEILLEAFAR
ncbi:GSCFA domain-containing protein [Chenggangzhangella methanolivorans]|uniref:GSCFA domain-containing protein n=1 Tax=Chenggangzhangella methanolivorans TaxID=1437009 RepID=A0A9E6RET5_9HYPH|nr:GSCFA domain-containing protein [Chenggangzhangella methanolivorans]QZN99900.1 GSCFA domain-containing protein [Chenggangzhangella methanolivorans]